jgi:hypothetical protein
MSVTSALVGGLPLKFFVPLHKRRSGRQNVYKNLPAARISYTFRRTIYAKNCAGANRVPKLRGLMVTKKLGEMHTGPMSLNVRNHFSVRVSFLMPFNFPKPLKPVQKLKKNAAR